MKKTTLQQIGDRLNLSKVAIYKALNNKPGIGAVTRELIIKTAREMNYSPPQSSIKTGLNFIFAIRKSFFISIFEQFYTAIYYNLNIECQYIDSNLKILLFDNGNFDELLKAEMNQRPMSGIFLVGEVEENVIKSTAELTVPVVHVDYYSPLYNFNYVYVDHYNMAFLATNHIIECGHTKIGFIGDVKATSAICDRFLGYRKSLLRAGLEFNDKWFINKNIESNLDVENILPEDMPTAFVCHCDLAAQLLYLALKLKNYKVPDDVSVIGFDNTGICKTMSPELTSIGVSKERFAKKSLELMLDLINGHNKESSKILKPSLHRRDSVKII